MLLQHAYALQKGLHLPSILVAATLVTDSQDVEYHTTCSDGTPRAHARLSDRVSDMLDQHLTAGTALSRWVLMPDSRVGSSSRVPSTSCLVRQPKHVHSTAVR